MARLEQRKERLARALRENLKRRKDRVRASGGETEGSNKCPRNNKADGPNPAPKRS
jgi:hypothetical protein